MKAKPHKRVILFPNRNMLLSGKHLGRTKRSRVPCHAAPPDIPGDNDHSSFFAIAVLLTFARTRANALHACANYMHACSNDMRVRRPHGNGNLTRETTPR